MILFLDEERAYLHWVTRHRDGFVLDCLRHPTKAYLVVHRAICSEVRSTDSKRTHWTTGRHMKGCSLDLEELKAWAADQTQHEPVYCPSCTPDKSPPLPGAHGEPHLTRLDRKILSFVLEVATGHLDEDDRNYSLSVGMVAGCLGKTERQLTASLSRLAGDGLLIFSAMPKTGEAFLCDCRIYPTADAMRTITAFAALDDAQIDAELGKLRHD